MGMSKWIGGVLGWIVGGPLGALAGFALDPAAAAATGALGYLMGSLLRIAAASSFSPDALLSGLAEPVGALMAWLVLMPFMSATLMGCILAGVAGIMVFISIDELLPAAREYGEAHTAIYGVVAGMAVMAGSLLLLN